MRIAKADSSILIDEEAEQPPPPPKQNPVQPTVAFVILAYMLCSSTMLIINKAAVKLFPAPATLLFLQTGFSALAIWFGGVWGLIEVDALDMPKVKAFSLVVGVFILNIFTNIKALEYSNVETVIVFQTLTSLVVAYGDYKLLKTGTPSSKIIFSLAIIVVGALLYVATDSQFKVEAYFWVVMYFAAKTSDMLYTKHIVDSVKMTSWGRSYYNNVLSMFPFALLALVKEKEKISELYQADMVTVSVMIVVLLSCLVGIGISISGFMCRAAISATSFSVVGNMNKVLTIFINFVVWDSHASLSGLGSLCICLFGGAYYAQIKAKM